MKYRDYSKSRGDLETIDIPPNEHGSGCTCERCFPNKFHTRDYSRRVLKRLCECWVRLYPDDVILYECWNRNLHLPVPLDEAKLRRLVEESIASKGVSNKPGSIFSSNIIAGNAGGASRFGQTKRLTSKGVPL